MNTSQSANNDAGFTIIEMMICICMISIALLGVSRIQLSAMKSNQKSTQMIIANLESAAAADLLLGMEFNATELANGNKDTLPSSSGVSIEYSVTDVFPFNSSEFYHSILLTTSWSDSAGNHSIKRILTKLP